MISPPEILKRGKRAVKHALLRSFGVVQTLGRRLDNAVLLTFDDGPHPDVTAGVLERLHRHNARGVFFIVGNRIPKAPAMPAQIAAAGHVIGNHSFSHPLYHKMRLPDYVRDLRRCQQTLEELTGRRPHLFRPPLGRLGMADLMAPKIVGLRTIYWSVDSDDWRLRNRDSALEIGERLGRSLRSGDIVLCHDDNPYLLPMLDMLLPALTARGCDLASAAEKL